MDSLQTSEPLDGVIPSVPPLPTMINALTTMYRMAAIRFRPAIRISFTPLRNFITSPRFHRRKPGFWSLAVPAEGISFRSAAQFPNAHCVGVDLSEVQVGYAQKAIDFCGLKNVEIIQRVSPTSDRRLASSTTSSLTVSFSWVPPFVRDAILRVSCENLSRTVLLSSVTTPFPVGTSEA